MAALLASRLYQENRDFGTAYAYLRPRWYTDCTNLIDELRHRETRDEDMRRDVLHGNILINGNVPPRYIWDLYSDRVVPWCVASSLLKEIWAVSHAWAGEENRVVVWTWINGRAWPVPLPRGASLELVRIELLRRGAEYVWLDVLCLRQAGGPREALRAEEWKLDVPTIGNVYIWAKKVVCYFGGLGLPQSRTVDMASDRSWFRRAWTLQEIKRRYMIGGETGKGLDEDARRIFERRLSALKEMRDSGIFEVLRQMQNRVSTNPVDRVAGLAYLLETGPIPAYYEAQSEEDAWAALVDVLDGIPRGDLFFLYPKAGDGNARWRPSWKQVMTEKLPDQQCDTWVNDDNTYFGCCIEKGEVQGLAEPHPEGLDREGELCVVDSAGVTHSFWVIAQHQYQIPDGAYTLIGYSAGFWEEGMIGTEWVIGHRQNNQFAKVSVITMASGVRNTLKELTGVVQQNVKVHLP